MGARPLGRVIQEKVKRPLAEELLFGKLSKGGLVRVDYAGESASGDELTFSFVEDRPKKVKGAATSKAKPDADIDP
jgi:ATP-dependent Clp protease ATP-binding subunit ClpA